MRMTGWNRTYGDGMEWIGPRDWIEWDKWAQDGMELDGCVTPGSQGGG